MGALLSLLLSFGGGFGGQKLASSLLSKLVSSGAKTGASSLAKGAGKVAGSGIAEFIGAIGGFEAGARGAEALFGEEPPLGNSENLAQLSSNQPKNIDLSNQISFEQQLQAEAESGNLGPLLEQLGQGGI